MAEPAVAPNPDVRERIIDEATRLFAHQGYAGTSIQEVSEAAGIRRPTLVYHFGSKDQLRHEVVARLFTHWKEEVPRVMAAATSGGDRFERALKAVISFFAAEPGRAKLIIRELMDRPREVKALLEEHLRPWIALVTDYIRTGQEGGSVRTDLDPESYVLQMVGQIISTVAAGNTAAWILADPPDLDRQLDELVRIARVSLFNPRPQV